jgi:hypothetical protein
MLDHACGSCGGRILASADGASVRCADCGPSASGGPEEICWCGALPAGSRVRLRCARNKHPTPESPGAIVAIDCGKDAAIPPSEVAYFQIDVIGCDKKFFRCQTLSSTLSVEGCSANWRRAQRVSADELGFSGKCRGCPVGAAHAHERQFFRSKIFDLGICPLSL